eukprot:15276194-Alexandrium_andersonii.AAC.1
MSANTLTREVVVHACPITSASVEDVETSQVVLSLSAMSAVELQHIWQWRASDDLTYALAADA